MGYKREPDPTFKTSTQHFLFRNRNMRNELLAQTDYLMLVDNYEKLTDTQKEEINNFIEFPQPPEWIGTLDLPKY